MVNEITTLLDRVKTDPTSVQFGEVLDIIEMHYKFRPTAFKNGDTVNREDQNITSCKLFAFAIANNLSKEDTLQLFGDYYRKDVLGAPDGTDHENIRNFMKYGWEELHFENTPLYMKQ
ncbi:MAG: HopJ type III effector protein [Cyclobacteriaceae bacterium]